MPNANRGVVRAAQFQRRLEEWEKEFQEDMADKVAQSLVAFHEDYLKPMEARLEAAGFETRRLEARVEELERSPWDRFKAWLAARK